MERDLIHLEKYQFGVLHGSKTLFAIRKLHVKEQVCFTIQSLLRKIKNHSKFYRYPLACLLLSAHFEYALNHHFPEFYSHKNK